MTLGNADSEGRHLPPITGDAEYGERSITGVSHNVPLGPNVVRVRRFTSGPRPWTGWLSSTTEGQTRSRAVAPTLERDFRPRQSCCVRPLRWQTLTVIGRRWLAMMLLGSLVWGACAANNVGRQGVLGRGTFVDSREPWTLSAGLDDGLLCLELYGGASCFPVPDGSAALWADGVTSEVAEADPEDGLTCASGAVSKEVERVSVRFADGVALDAQIIPGQGWAVDFYAICIGRPSVVEELTLFDDENEILHRSGSAS